MRVLHVIPAVAPRYGGPSYAIVGMARALRTAQTDVLIATTDADGSDRLPLQLESRVDWQGVPTIFFHRQWTEAWKYSHPLARWLATHVADWEVTHIHGVYSHACVAAASASRAHGIPYIVRPFGTLDPWSLRQKPLRKRVLWWLSVKRMLAGASAIHYTTASEQRLAEGPLGLSRGVVVPLGVEDAFLDAPVVSPPFRETLPQLGKHPYVLTLGRLHPKKGIELLIDAFLDATDMRHLQHWRLLVAGDGDANYVNRLKAFVRTHNAEQRVLFAGWVDGRRKMAALQDAGLLALTSHAENFGLAVAEALACGIPVVVSEHVNLADEILKAQAGWIVPLQPTAIAATLQEALSGDAERRWRGANARAFARSEFRWSNIASALLEVYTGVCSKN
ncbi:MAG: glycosyltransferase [Chloroflexi bacterium]|nr:glycosyltransferase [Chloroflexota bacterium]